MQGWMWTDPETGVIYLDYTQLAPGTHKGADERINTCSVCQRPGVFKKGYWVHKARVGLGIAKPFKRTESYQVIDDKCKEG